MPGEVTPREARDPAQGRRDHLDEIRNAGLYDAIWQAFAVLLPVHTRRRHGRRAHLRVRLRGARRHSTDGMTADWFRFPHEVLGRVRDPHRQRGARHQPRRLRHHLEAARHDRVGIGVIARTRAAAMVCATLCSARRGACRAAVSHRRSRSRSITSIGNSTPSRRRRGCTATLRACFRASRSMTAPLPSCTLHHRALAFAAPSGGWHVLWLWRHRIGRQIPLRR